MKRFVGFEKGMGIGGWLTNYKRFHVLPMDRRLVLTVGDMEHFANYITEADVKNIRDMGLDHIRVGFDQIVLEESPYRYREETMAILQRFAGWCRRYGLGVVLNLHKAIGNYCDIPEKVKLLENAELQERFIALWEELERRFADYPEAAFEILNEVRDDVTPEAWNDLADRTIRRLRSMNPTRKIIVGSICYGSAYTLDTLKIWDDENVIYTFHTYNPFSFTHQQGVLQAGPLYYNRKMPYPGDIERYRDYERVVNGDTDPMPGYTEMGRQYVWDTMKGAADFIAAHPDKILWCGEFGTIRHADPRWRENWMRDVIAFFKAHEIPYSVWNYLSTPNDGNRFSLVDDDTRKILTPELGRIIRGEVE